MATKGTFHQKRGDIGRIDFLLADAVSSLASVKGDSFYVVINALEHYREALVSDVIAETPCLCSATDTCLWHAIDKAEFTRERIGI